MSRAPLSLGPSGMTISPLPGVDTGTITEALRNAARSAENERGKGGLPVERFNNYQRWATEHADRLSGLMRAPDVDKLITTRRYWLLQSIDPTAHGDIGQLVDAELTGRIRDFDQALLQLDRHQHRWAARRGLVIVPDTNVFLHHDEYFDTLPWKTLVQGGISAGVHLVIPMLIVEELDRAKTKAKNITVNDRNLEAQRTRARLTLRKLDEIFSGDPIPAQPLVVGTPDLSIELLFDDLQHERLTDNDAEIIDRARALQDLHRPPGSHRHLRHSDVVQGPSCRRERHETRRRPVDA